MLDHVADRQPTESVELRRHYENEGRQLERYSSPSYWDSRYHRERFGMVCELLRGLSPDGLSFLDVGAGTGEYLDFMQSVGVAEAVALDLSHAYCVRLVKRSSLVTQASASSLPFASASVDIVLCSEVIEHIPRSAAKSVITELCRVAARAVVVTTPNRDATIRRLGRRVAHRSVDALDQEVGHINLMNALELTALLNIEGWTLHPLRVVHILPPVVGERFRIPPRASSAVSRLERWATGVDPSRGNALAAVLTR